LATCFNYNDTTLISCFDSNTAKLIALIDHLIESIAIKGATIAAPSAVLKRQLNQATIDAALVHSLVEM
jgi:hypothetical protein